MQILLSNSVVFPKSYFKYITPPKAVKRFEIIVCVNTLGVVFLGEKISSGFG
jgi:hypothetical protein